MNVLSVAAAPCQELYIPLFQQRRDVSYAQISTYCEWNIFVGMDFEDFFVNIDF